MYPSVLHVHIHDQPATIRSTPITTATAIITSVFSFIEAPVGMAKGGIANDGIGNGRIGFGGRPAGMLNTGFCGKHKIYACMYVHSETRGIKVNLCRHQYIDFALLS